MGKPAPFYLWQKLVTGFALPVIFVIAFSFFIKHTIESSIETADWVHHTEEVLAKANHLEKLMVDMETGMRGYLITGSDTFLEPYIKSKLQWDDRINALQTLVSDNPPQVDRAKEIERLAQKWIEGIAKPSIALRREVKASGQNLDLIVQHVETQDGKMLMDEIRERLIEFKAVEEQLMEVRYEEASESAQFALIISSYGLPLLIIVTSSFAIVILMKAMLTPIRNLRTATDKIAKGDYSQELNIKSNDEIGELADSFNEMSLAIQNSKLKTES